MNLEQELVVAGRLPPEVAKRVALLPTLRPADLKRYKVVAPDPHGMVVVCYGRLLEAQEIAPSSGAAPRRMILNCLTGGTLVLADQLIGVLRTHSPTARALLVGSEWREDQVLCDHALSVALQHGRSQTAKVMHFAFGTCRERLEYLRDVLRVDLSQWHRQELAAMTGVSREMVSRVLGEKGKFGALHAKKD